MSNIAMNNTINSDKYTIVGRYMDGVNVVGYHIMDRLGNSQATSKDIVDVLALDKRIINCIAQKYNGGIVIKGIQCKISELPTIDVNTGKLRGEDKENSKKTSNIGKYTIMKRISKGKATLGYVLRDAAGIERNIKREDVIKLAREGKLVNARAQLSNNVLVLRGVDFELSQLPNIKIS